MKVAGAFKVVGMELSKAAVVLVVFTVMDVALRVIRIYHNMTLASDSIEGSLGIFLSFVEYAWQMKVLRFSKTKLL